MAFMKHRIARLLLPAASLVLAASLAAQHVTLEDELNDPNVKPEKLLAALRNMPQQDSQNFELKTAVIRALGKPGNVIAVNQLLLTLGEGSTQRVRLNGRDIEYWKVRAESAISLGKIGDKSVTPKLIETAMGDEDLQVRICAIRGLGILKDGAAVPRLIDMLERTTTDRVAYEIVKALREIGDKRAFPVLLAVTQRDFSEMVRKEALSALRILKWE